MLCAIALVPLLFMLAGLAGSVIPARSEPASTEAGVLIHVYTNGVHTGLVLPTVNAIHDWRDRIAASDLPDPERAGQWLIFGWGDRTFYLETPRWSDVKITTAARAVIGSKDTLIHVDHLRRLWRGPDLRPIRLSADQYRALVRAIEGDFAPGGAIAGYGADDVFYPARGRYSALRTCNEWTGDKLRRIGVRIGIWTPLSWSVMRWFPDPGAVSPRS